MPETPLLSLPLLDASQAQKHITHNEALLLLDAALHLSVASRTANAPPGSPQEGDRHIAGVSPTARLGGAGGQARRLSGRRLAVLDARTGWRVWVEDEEKFLLHDGAGWRDLQAITELANMEKLGINATADGSNRLTVSSPGVLLTHAGSDQRLKVNKNLAADTATLLFQTGYSGRAEMGLPGDDDFHVKVSGDGSSWKDALIIDGVTGEISFPHSPAFEQLAFVDFSAAQGPVYSAQTPPNSTAWPWYRTTNGTEGLFRWEAAVPIATHQADTLQGIYVAPNPAANGAWVRQHRGEMRVEWFGAKADYSMTARTGTDNTAAVQAAINAARAANDGGVVRFGPGRFHLPSLTSLDPGLGNLVFEGAGMNATFLHIEEGPDEANKRYAFRSRVDNVKDGGITFRGICFHGTRDVTPRASGANPLYLDFYPWIHIEECRFVEIAGMAMDFHRIGQFKCVNSWFENIGKDSVRARDVASAIVTGNHFYKTGDDAVALHTQEISDIQADGQLIRERLIVANNVMVNTGRGVVLLGAKGATVTATR